MPRRVYTYNHGGLWEAYNLASTIGAGILALGFVVFVVNVVRTTRRGARAGNDPWLGDTLEWFPSSPPPPENFARPVPYVSSPRPLRDLRERLKERSAPL
jgi:heme/copper-type cytochrome/quinol oxidase subunit 1